MPNHVTTKLTFDFDKSTTNIYKVLELFATETEEYLRFPDFNKVIPTPSNIFQGDLGRSEREKYGENNWYDWNLKNWGTKWNAYNCYEYGDAFFFDTAWAFPEPVMESLSRQLPDVIITCKWADEDRSYNLGEVRYLNGEEIYSYLPNEGSREAWEFLFENGFEDISEYELVDSNYQLAE